MRLLFAFLLLALASCASAPPLPDAGDSDVILLGEQHDAVGQPRLQLQWVAGLAQQGRLAAFAIEMAERGTSTAGLPASASQEQVRQALHWDTRGWPWDRYGPTILAAVRAGVPVLGANLPVDQQQHAMDDRALDRLLTGPALKAQQQAIRIGHCGLLPESQIGPMTRIQIARDQAMARTIAVAAVPGKVVVLLAGAGHVQQDVGVPVHLPASLRIRTIVLPQEQGSGVDHCAELRKRLERKAS